MFTIAYPADMNLRDTFQHRIANNPYPGRGVVVGRNSQGDWTLIYWIMGRSPNSRNRKFVATGGTLRTEAVDPAKVEDPSLIIYEAMLELPGVQLLSNGDQTRTIWNTLSAGGSFIDALKTRAHEPDAPNFTPRISAQLDLRNDTPSIQLSLLRVSPQTETETDRCFFSVAPPAPGTGRALTTYMGDGNPLPSFSGEPLLLPCEGNTQDILNTYWGSLNAENRVALAVKRVTAAGACAELLIRNQYVD